MGVNSVSNFIISISVLWVGLVHYSYPFLTLDSELLRNRFSYGPHSTSVVLRSKEIQFIVSNTFEDYFNLFLLDVQNNKLTTLPENLLWNNKRLNVLSLSSNMIQTLPENIFHHSPNLAKLYLSDNLLEFLPSTVFSRLTKLIKLTLHNNRLQSIPSTLFNGLQNFEYFSLSQNYININCSDVVYLQVKDCCLGTECQKDRADMPCLTSSLPNVKILDEHTKGGTLPALTQLSFGCSQGFVTTNENATLICVNGKWNYSAPLCTMRTTTILSIQQTTDYPTENSRSQQHEIASSSGPSSQFLLIFTCLGVLLVISTTMIAVVIIIYNRPRTVLLDPHNSISEKQKKLSNASFLLSPASQFQEGKFNLYCHEPEGESEYEYAPVFRTDGNHLHMGASGIYEEVNDYNDTQ